MLNSVDVFALSNESALNVVVKDGSFADISENVAREVQLLRDWDGKATDEAGRVFQAAGIGKGGTNQVNTAHRSDLRCWITPDLCKEHKLTHIETLIKRLIRYCAPLKAQHQLNGDYSVQLTLYPGNGSHYVRHLDTFTTPSDAKKSYRRFTLLYYLNATHTGGQLRVYRGDESLDIDPIMNRLVVFRSDTVEHEVLPCHTDRIAFSLWASSSLPPNAPPRPGPALPSPPVPPKPIPAPSTQGPPPLTIPDRIGSDTSHPVNIRRIFVSLINYRDSEGPHTIRDCFARAAHPERLFLGVVFQGDPHQDADCVFSGFPAEEVASLGGRPDLSSHVRTLSMLPSAARGPCLARHLAMSLWQGEEYFLQIDSHMRFRQGWDSYLIHVLESIRQEGASAKPALSTYPLGYTLPNGVPNDTRPTVLVPTKFDEDGILRQSARVVQPSSSSGAGTAAAPLYLRSPLWASGFHFSDGSLIEEVPYNPYLHYLFFGEEVSMAARMFTHGYDFYAPTEAVLYHLYSRAHRPTFQEVQPADREVRRAASQEEVRRLLGMGEGSPVARFGLGTARTLAEWESSIGVKFVDRKVDLLSVDWDEYINSAAISDEALSRFEFISDGRDVFSPPSVGNPTDPTSLLSQLAGLDRVMQFLGK